MDELGCLWVCPFRFEFVLVSLCIKVQALGVFWYQACFKSNIKSILSLRASFTHV